MNITAPLVPPDFFEKSMTALQTTQALSSNQSSSPPVLSLEVGGGVGGMGAGHAAGILGGVGPIVSTDSTISSSSHPTVNGHNGPYGLSAMVTVSDLTGRWHRPWTVDSSIFSLLSMVAIVSKNQKLIFRIRK